MDVAYWIGTIVGVLFGILLLYMTGHIVYDFFKDHIIPRLKSK